MIDTLEALQGLLLASLFNPALLAFFVAVFLLGKLAGYLTQNIRLWKILLLLYMSIFLFEPLRHVDFR